MLVVETKTPEGVIVKPSEDRNYTISGREFKYTSPSSEIVTFDDCTLTSGSWEHGLAGVVKDNKFFHNRFTKDAQNFRTKSPFWSNAKESFEIDIDNDYVDRYVFDECFTWFNIGQYWHWFFEDLPLIEAFRQKPDVPIVTNHLKQYQLDSLSYFPDIEERIVEVDTPCLVQAKKVHVATYPAISYRGQVASWAVEFLRDNLKPEEPGKHDRIYISRNDAIARNVKNEPAVIDMLVNEFGFVPFNTHKENSMSNMPLKEKLRLFASASIVVSPTGAGLSHTHAMKPETHVIDFNHEFEVSEECGWNNIAPVCGLNWQTLVAETMEMPPERPKLKNSHLHIDIDTLRQAVKNAIT
jgi:capsular polysaccharide biosynthesis protein